MFKVCFWSQGGQDAKILDAIKTQVGVGQYLAAIQMLKQTPEFIAGVDGLQVPRHVPQSSSSFGDEAGTIVSLPSQSNVVSSCFATSCL